MTNRVLLNNVDHQDVRVRIGHAAELGDAVNQITVFPTEFEGLQAEYPILIRRNPDGTYYSVVLLGLDSQENLFLADGAWQGRYVPALLQRGPFSIGVPEEGQSGEPMIHIDLDNPRVGSEGEPLFRPHGGNAPYLDHVAGVLRAIFVGSQANAPMFAALDEAGLIQPVKLELELSDGRRYDVPDGYTIDQARLRDLDGATLERLNRQDFLRAAIWIASSLRNVSRLIDIKSARSADA